MSGSPPTVQETGRWRAWIGRRWPAVLTVLAAVVLSNSYAQRFVAAEHTLYAADYVAYWAFSENLSRQISAAPLSALVSIADSVARRELNLLPATPIAVVMLVFGSSRLVYVLAVLNLYALPSLVLLFCLVRRLCAQLPEATASLVLWATATAVLLVPVYFWPISLGYLGVGGVALGLLAFLLYFAPPGGRQDRLHLIAVGVLLVVIFLFRRWYAFWAVGFGLMVLADAGTRLCFDRPLDRSRLWAAVRAPVLIGASAVVSSMVLAAPVVLHVLRTDYGQLFSAFKIHQGVAAELLAWVRHFGIAALCLLVVGLVVTLYRPDLRRVAALLGLQMVATFVLMRRVQDPSPQHWYLYAAVVLVLVIFGLLRIVDSMPGRRSRVAVMASLSFAGLLSTAWMVVAPRTLPVPLVSTARFQPQVREDLGEVRGLLGFLDRQLALAPGYVYVIGSTPTLSDTSLAYANLSLGSSYASPAAVLQSVHLDSRDGFPLNLLRCRYVVVSSPVQMSRPELQQVVQIPAEQILEGRGLGSAFSRLPEVFELDGGAATSVYQLWRPLTVEDVNSLVVELQAAFP